MTLPMIRNAKGSKLIFTCGRAREVLVNAVFSKVPVEERVKQQRSVSNAETKVCELLSVGEENHVVNHRLHR